MRSRWRNAVAYLEAGSRTRHGGESMGVASRVLRLSSHFLESRKFRAARRLWARDARSVWLAARARSSSGFTPRRPAVRCGTAARQQLVRVTPAQYAIHGGARRCTANGRAKRWRAQAGIRTLAIGSSRFWVRVGCANTVDTVAALRDRATDQRPRRAARVMRRYRSRGGSEGIELAPCTRDHTNRPKRRSARLESGEATVVASPAFIGRAGAIPIFHDRSDIESQQRELSVPSGLARGRAAAALTPFAVRRRSATCAPGDRAVTQRHRGEISDTLKGVFGEHHDAGCLAQI